MADNRPMKPYQVPERISSSHGASLKDRAVAAMFTSRAQVLAAEAAQPKWPAGLLDRIKAAEQRVQDNRAPRSIPADPHSDVDLVLAEVRYLIEGNWPPFWIKDGSGVKGPEHG